MQIVINSQKDFCTYFLKKIENLKNYIKMKMLFSVSFICHRT